MGEEGAPAFDTAAAAAHAHHVAARMAAREHHERYIQQQVPSVHIPSFVSSLFSFLPVCVDFLEVQWPR